MYFRNGWIQGLMLIEHFFFLSLSYLQFFPVSFFVLVPLFQCCLSLRGQKEGYRQLRICIIIKAYYPKGREAPLLP